MENRLSNLISALTELTDDLKDIATADAVQNDGRLELGGFYNPEAEEKKKNEEFAQTIAEKIDKNAKDRDKENDQDEFAPRKILAKVVPTNIVSFDKTALKQLSSIMPVSCCNVIKEAVEENKKKDDDNDPLSQLKGLGGLLLGILTALGIGALVTHLEDIKKLIEDFKNFNIKDWLFSDNRTPIENLPVAVKAVQKVKQMPKPPPKVPVGKELANIKRVDDVIKATSIADTNKKITALADDLVKLTAQIDDLGKLPVEDTKAFRTKWNEKTLGIKDNFTKLNKEIDAVFDATKNRPELAQAARNLQAKTVSFISQNQKLLTASADDIIKTPTLVNDYITKANKTSKNLATQLTKYGDEMAAIDKNIAELRKLGTNVKTVVDGQLIEKVKTERQTTANRMIKAIDDYTSSVKNSVGKIEANAKAASNVLETVVTDSSRFTISEDTIKSLQQNQRAASSSVTSNIDNINKVYKDITISAKELNKMIDSGQTGPVSGVADEVAKVTTAADDALNDTKGKSKWRSALDDAKQAWTDTKKGFVQTISDITGWVKDFMGPEGPVQKGWEAFKNTPAYQTISKYGGKFLTAAKGILKYVLMPIFAVMSIVDAAKAAMKGYEEDGISKAITEGINSLIDFWIFDTIKLIRDIGTWVLGAIGLDRVEKGFDEETDKLMDDMLKQITNLGGFVKGLVTGDVDRIKKEFVNLVETSYQIVAGGISSIISAAVNTFKDIADIWDAGGDQNPYNFKKEVLDPLWNSLKEFLKKTINYISVQIDNGFEDIKTKIKDSLSSLWDAVVPDWMSGDDDKPEKPEERGPTRSKRPRKTVPVPAAANNLSKTGLVPAKVIKEWSESPDLDSYKTEKKIEDYLRDTGVTLDGKQVKSWQVQNMQPADVDKLVKKMDDVVQSSNSTGKLDRKFDNAAQYMKSMALEKQRNPRLTPSTIPFPNIPEGESFETGPTMLKYNIKTLEDKLSKLDDEADKAKTMAEIRQYKKQLLESDRRSIGLNTVLAPNTQQQSIKPVSDVVAAPAMTPIIVNEQEYQRTKNSPMSGLDLTQQEIDAMSDLTRSNKQLAQALTSGDFIMDRDVHTGNLKLKYKNLDEAGNIISAGAYEFKENAMNIEAAIHDAGSNINSGAQSILDATQPEFPRRQSPAAWEYIRDAGKELNAGSKRLYDQAVEYNKQSRDINKLAKPGDDKLSKKVEEMVKILGENSEIQRKTLEALQQHGLIDKQGDTIVNNGGNSTTINNMSVESDIMSFRDRVIGRLQPK